MRIQSVGPVNPEGLTCPDEIKHLWRVHGAGFIGEGFLRLADPHALLPVLPSFVADPQDCVPIFTTALADVVVWRGGYFFNLSTRLGVAHSLSHSKPEYVLRFLEDPYLLDKDFRWHDFRPAAERLGVPDFTECFYYVPLLSQGGVESPEHLRRGGLIAHLEMAAGLQGRVTIGPA
ncbi:T6SS immunity protein Tdi1 domain-containing protein [Enemella sp. A6]|uniref:T6SS immunity protein Tdi1 domain-containing protein n=1 Tax=Enemella sp. A6 TaxID=3440152 RepID=UPI003EB9DA60